MPKSADPAIREIYNQFLWLLYCDLREHRLIGADKLSQVQRDAAARCVLFLKSGLPYLWPVLSRGQSALLERVMNFEPAQLWYADDPAQAVSEQRFR